MPSGPAICNARRVGIPTIVSGLAVISEQAVLGISEAVEETLDRVDGAPARDLDDLLEADAEARRVTEAQPALA